jgi:hypothetical protein
MKGLKAPELGERAMADGSLEARMCPSEQHPGPTERNERWTPRSDSSRPSHTSSSSATRQPPIVWPAAARAPSVQRTRRRGSRGRSAHSDGSSGRWHRACRPEGSSLMTTPTISHEGPDGPAPAGPFLLPAVDAGGPRRSPETLRHSLQRCFGIAYPSFREPVIGPIDGSVCPVELVLPHTVRSTMRPSRQPRPRLTSASRIHRHT